MTPKTPAKPAAPSVPPAPPPAASLPPPLVVPTRPNPPPTPVPIVADAPGEPSPITGGVRLTFGGGRSDLNPRTDAALRTLVHPQTPGAAPDPTSLLTVSAYAAGAPEDPSTPRRVSLSRALAVRSVLIAEGIPSVRIIVKALGATGPALAEGPADRVDVVVGQGAPAPAAAPPAPAAPSPPAAAATKPAAPPTAAPQTAATANARAKR